jgi:AraC-like DNA-binding protein
METYYHPQTHSEYILFICLAGTLSMKVAGETHVIGPGNAIICNGGGEHATGCVSGQARCCEILSLTFSQQLLMALGDDFQLPASDGRMCPEFIGSFADSLLHKCALDIKRELSNRETRHKIVAETLAMRLFTETLRSWPRPQIKQALVDFVPRLTWRDFIRTYEFMRQCPKETFRMQHLSSFLGISEERFTRLFFASTHHTPANFYNRMLLVRGRDLLRDPALSIKEISFELGFKTTSHFIASFRREFATTPQGYRGDGRTGPSPVAAEPPVFAGSLN